MRSFDELSDIDAANIVRCARVLLRRPLLHAGGPDGSLLPMIYRQRAVLQELFNTLLGYRLVVERRFARLYKTGPGQDSTRGVAALSPRGYAYLALTLAALTGVGRQVLLSRLVSDVRAAATEAEVTIVDDPADRRALAAALRHLVSLGVISETEGTVDTASEALITIDTDLLGQLIAGPLSSAATPEELIALGSGTGRPHAQRAAAERAAAERAGPEQTGPEQAGMEQSVRRRLVEDPVVLFGALPPEQARWLRGRQGTESKLLERYFGLVTETRSEGIAVTDPEDYLTDVVFPGPSTVARIALLALPDLLARAQPRDPTGEHPLTRQDFVEIGTGLVESHPAAWSRLATEDPDELAESVIALLRQLGLLREDRESGWLLSPAAHRWLPHPDASPAPRGAAKAAEPPPEPPAWSLFDERHEAEAR